MASESANLYHRSALGSVEFPTKTRAFVLHDGFCPIRWEPSTPSRCFFTTANHYRVQPLDATAEEHCQPLLKGRLPADEPVPLYSCQSPLYPGSYAVGNTDK